MPSFPLQGEEGGNPTSQRKCEKKMHELLKQWHLRDEQRERLAKLSQGMLAAEEQEQSAKRRVLLQEEAVRRRRKRTDELTQTISQLKDNLAEQERVYSQLNPGEEQPRKSPLTAALAQPWSIGSLPTLAGSSTTGTTESTKRKFLASMPQPKAVAGIHLYKRGVAERAFDPERVRAETAHLLQNRPCSTSALSNFGVLAPQQCEGSRANNSAKAGQGETESGGTKDITALDGPCGQLSFEEGGDSTTLPSLPSSQTQMLQAGDSLWSSASSWASAGSPRIGTLQRLTTRTEAQPTRAQTAASGASGRDTSRPDSPSYLCHGADKPEVSGTLDEWFSLQRIGSSQSQSSSKPRSRNSRHRDTRSLRSTPVPQTPQRSIWEEQDRLVRQQSAAKDMNCGRAALRQALVDLTGGPLQAFDKLDLNHSGSISFTEFATGMDKLGIDWQGITGLTTMRDLFRMFDHNRSGHIDPGKLFPVSFVPLSVQRALGSTRASTPQFWESWCDQPMAGGRTPKWNEQGVDREVETMLQIVRAEDLQSEKRKQMKGMISRLKHRGKSDTQCREIVARHLPKGTGPKDRNEVNSFTTAEVELCKRIYQDELQDKVRSIEKVVQQLHSSRSSLHAAKQQLGKLGVDHWCRKRQETQARKMLHGKSVANLVRSMSRPHIYVDPMEVNINDSPEVESEDEVTEVAS